MAGNRTMLLLGSCGFAGSHVREAALSAGIDVIGAERDRARAELQFDLLDPASIEAVIEASRPSWIVNMAGLASVRESWNSPDATFAVNALGVLNLLFAAARHAPSAHILCVSSAEVYGSAPPEAMPLRETDPTEPVSPYGASKLAMEIVCGQFARSHDLRIAVVRAFNQIGPGQSEEFVVPGLARQIALAQQAGRDRVDLTVGNLSAARDFTDIRDTARAYSELAKKESTGTFNVCSGRAVRIDEVIEQMQAATDLKIDVSPEEGLMRRADAPLVYGAPDAIRDETGWQPEIPLTQTIEDVVDWWNERLSDTEVLNGEGVS